MEDITFKVGDKVRVKSDSNTGKGWYRDSKCNKILYGKTFKVTKYIGDTNINIDLSQDEKYPNLNKYFVINIGEIEHVNRSDTKYGF